MAIDYRTGERKWQHEVPADGWGSSQQPGVLTTGGGLRVQRRSVRQLHRVRRRHGQDPVARAARRRSSPTRPQTYMLDGRQYITVAAGDTLFAFYLQ